MIKDQSKKEQLANKCIRALTTSLPPRILHRTGPPVSIVTGASGSENALALARVSDWLLLLLRAGSGCRTSLTFVKAGSAFSCGRVSLTATLTGPSFVDLLTGPALQSDNRQDGTKLVTLLSPSARSSHGERM